MKQKNITALLATLLALILVATACTPAPPTQPSQAASVAEPAAQPAASPAQWPNSTINGNVIADTSPNVKDDFYLAHNHAWLSSAKLGVGEIRVGAFSERSKEVQKEIEVILNDTSLQSHEAKLVQRFYQEFLDMETRNRVGAAPFQKIVDDIKSLSTLDALSTYLVTENQNTLSGAAVSPDFMDSSRHAVMIWSGPLSLQDADEYREMTATGKRTKEALDVFNIQALVRLGYTEAEAQAAWDAAFAFETQLAQASLGSSATYQPDFYEKIYNPMTLAELEQASPAYPLVRDLKERGFAESDILVVTDTAWLSKLNELYTEENLEAIKSSMIVLLAGLYSEYLDEEFLTLKGEYTSAVTGSTGAKPLEKQAFDMVNLWLGKAVGELYVEQYFSDETKADVEQLITDTKAIYRQRLEQSDWLGEETKEKAIEKLDKMGMNVGYPRSTTDYSELVFRSAQEGWTLVDVLEAIGVFDEAQEAKKVNTRVDKNKGDAISQPQIVNAFYDPSNNSINIPAGILGGIFYDANATEAARMGAIGTVIGHEITHAFDTLGSQYDADGNLSNWWTEADAAAFRERTDKVAAYFGGIEVLPDEMVNGPLVVTEATADLGGVSSMLELAKGIPGFDYEDFFTSHAQIWREVQTTEYAQIRQTDPHPPNYLRANVTLQQFEEFYDTYGITEGDGMYLAPEKRLSVW